jgi:hypothetical protein
MAFAIVVGVVPCVLFGLWRRRRVTHRDAENLELLAAVVLYDEMTAAIGALDLALRNDDPKWLASMSESRTLSEAWYEHAEDLAALPEEHWAVVSDAVTAMAPGQRSVLASAGRDDDLRPSLTQSRELLVQGAEILRAVRDR